MEEIVREVCGAEVEADAMRFDSDTVRGRQTRPEEEYRGVEVRLIGLLERAWAPIKVDVGFGDVVVPEPVRLDYPTILDFPTPRLHAYTRESVIAEKFHAMVLLGGVNGRFKDFYDVWYRG